MDFMDNLETWFNNWLQYFNEMVANFSFLSLI